MVNIVRNRTPQIQSDIMSRLGSVLTFSWLCLVLIGFVALPILAVNWLNLPFLGAFVGQTLVISNAEPTIPGNWALRSFEINTDHQLLKINETSIGTPGDLTDALGTHQLQDEVQVTIQNSLGELIELPVRLDRFPPSDVVSYLVIPYGVGLVMLVISLYMFGIRRQDDVGRTFAIFSAAAAFSISGVFDLFTSHHLAYLWTTALALSAAALLHLAMIFPDELGLVRRYPFLRWTGYFLAMILIVYAIPTVYDLTRPTAYLTAWRLEYIFLGFSLIVFIFSLFRRLVGSNSFIVREQSRLTSISSFVGFSPLIIWLIITSINPDFNFSAWFLVPTVIFPLSIGYSILRYRSLNTDYILGQAVLYALLTVIAGAGYALLVSGLSLLLGNSFQSSSPLLIGSIVFVLALLLNPLRLWLQTVVDTTFFRGQVVYRNRLQNFGRELTQALDLQAIIKLLRAYISQTLMPMQLHIYVLDPAIDVFVATLDDTGKLTSDLHFVKLSPLVQILQNKRDYLLLGPPGAEDVKSFPKELRPEGARLALLDCQLFIPLSGHTTLIGWLALGPRRSGEAYTTRDMNYLGSLSDQAALAIERSQVVANLERRVREMNVLTRVSQGINITLTFDDILELIYAQTSQVLPVRDLRVTLYDQPTSTLSNVFFLENDERIGEKEGKLLPDHHGLEFTVVESQRPLLTDDYEQECRSHGITPIAHGAYAWMGVPMISGSELVGTMSVFSRDPALVFTDDQLNLFQAIADQVAGAIVKSRLLSESERRAQQLTSLNEIGRSLTSTLELRPLLNRILNSAVEILSCEAGSLFLIDEQTQELVFEVVLGPVAADLTGRRLPAGTGLVGQVAQTGRAMIANDTKRHKEWFEQTDLQTGFDTQDMLIVPMSLQENVIGVIEVINKKDGSPFHQNDQELLTTFTSQATIAIQNARLYEMTDQALAARVEELSVMGRIDHELNASLEVERAMRITLDWAMRQSRVNAGLVGILEGGQVRVVVSQGYGDELNPYKKLDNSNRLQIYLPEPLVIMKPVEQRGERQVQIILTRVPQSTGETGVEEPWRLLRDAGLQIIIPIMREGVGIGVLFLEDRSTDPIEEETVQFLSRLVDHAAIAISNAQLYAEVEAANLAKSKFVSLVAHELKNPMTVIKGNTELVLRGMAGPVTDLQQSFLGTVRTNVERMNTIVSDLDDLTKIQVGCLRLEYRVIDLLETIQGAIHSLTQQLREKEQHIDLQVPGSIPKVWADAGRMHQVLLNLLSNAIKYSPEQSVIQVGAEQLAAEPATGGLMVVHVWVKDNGIGIPKEDQAKVFESYFRSDISREAASGTGLGLHITKSLVEMQGGRIWFESDVGFGSTFHVTFPVADSA